MVFQAADKRRKGFALSQIKNTALREKIKDYADKNDIEIIDGILDIPEHWANIEKELEIDAEENFNKWKEYDLQTAIYAMCGLGIALINYEYSESMAKTIAYQ